MRIQHLSGIMIEIIYSQYSMGANQISNLIRSNKTLELIMDKSDKSRQQVSILMAKFTSNIKFENQLILKQENTDFNLTQSIVDLFWHHRFQQMSAYWLQYLIKYLKKLLKKKTMFFISNEEWQLCRKLSQFLLLICDQEIISFLNQRQALIGVVGGEQKQFKRKNKISSILTTIENGFKTEVASTIRQFMYYSVQMKNKVVPNFTVSFTIINTTIQCLLCLYAKLVNQSIKLENWKRNFTIAAFSLGIGVEYENDSFINISVYFLTQVLKNHLKEKGDSTKQKLTKISKSYFNQNSIPESGRLSQSIICLLIQSFVKKIPKVDKPLVLNAIYLALDMQVNYAELLKYFEKFGNARIDGMRHIQNMQYRVIKKYKRLNQNVGKKLDQFILRVETFNFSDKDQHSQFSMTGTLSEKSKETEIAQGTDEKYIDYLYHQSVLHKYFPDFQFDRKNSDQDFRIGSAKLVEKDKESSNGPFYIKIQQKRLVTEDEADVQSKQYLGALKFNDSSQIINEQNEIHHPALKRLQIQELQ